jgi:hypothetical protein
MSLPVYPRTRTYWGSSTTRARINSCTIITAASVEATRLRTIVEPNGADVIKSNRPKLNRLKLSAPTDSSMPDRIFAAFRTGAFMIVSFRGSSPRSFALSIVAYAKLYVLHVGEFAAVSRGNCLICALPHRLARARVPPQWHYDSKGSTWHSQRIGLPREFSRLRPVFAGAYLSHRIVVGTTTHWQSGRGKEPRCTRQERVWP